MMNQVALLQKQPGFLRIVGRWAMSTADSLVSYCSKGAEYSKARKCKWLSRFHHFNFEKVVGCPVTLGCLAFSTGICVFIANAREGNPIKRPQPGLGSGCSSQRGGDFIEKSDASKTWDKRAGLLSCAHVMHESQKACVCKS
jgi:hypothetical protein